MKQGFGKQVDGDQRALREMIYRIIARNFSEELIERCDRHDVPEAKEAVKSETRTWHNARHARGASRFLRSVLSILLLTFLHSVPTSTTNAYEGHAEILTFGDLVPLV